MLVECDPSIKAIINKIDEQHNHAFVIDDIDDEHLLVKTDKHEELKELLKDVSSLHSLATEVESGKQGLISFRR